MPVRIVTRTKRPHTPHPRACIVCGRRTRGRVDGHAACPAHFHTATILLAVRALHTSSGGTVLGVADYTDGRDRLPMGTLEVSAAALPAGGRVLLDLNMGDREAPHRASLVLRISTAEALARMLASAVHTAAMMAPYEPPAGKREAAPEAPPPSPPPSGDVPGEEPTP